MRLLMTIMIIIVFIVLLIYASCNTLKTYTISKSPTPKTLIIASTHGNEPAGYHALTQYLNTNPEILKGTLIIVPLVNTCGLFLNKRNNPAGNYDINRCYPNKTYLNTQLSKLVNKADYIFDLHEGYDFHKLNKSSVGSGIYPGNTMEAQHLANILVESLNSTIQEDHKKFVTYELSPIQGSLREYADSINKHYILIETTGINHAQPLSIRVEQHTKIITDAINYLHNK